MQTPTPTVDPQSAALAASAADGIVAGFSSVLGFILTVNIIFAIICTLMARSRGRSAVYGFAGGLIFGILACLYYLIAGDTVKLRVQKEEAARQELERERVLAHPHISHPHQHEAKNPKRNVRL